MAISQRGTSGTVSGAYMVDRWYANQSGTAPTWSQIYGTLFAPQRYGLQITGATGNTSTQINQRIESVNSVDLANGVVTVSGYFYQDTGSTMTLPFQIFYATVGVDNYTSGIASITAVNASLPSGVWTYLNKQITLPSAATQGIQLAITPTALAASKIFVMSEVQLEKGSTATSFDYRPYGTELLLCQRYCIKYTNATSGTYGYFPVACAVDGTTTAQGTLAFPVPIRSPSILSLTTTGTAANYSLYSAAAVRALSVVPAISTANNDGLGCQLTLTVTAGLVSGNSANFIGLNSASPYLLFQSEL
jgi:hypothetical protein